MFLSRLVYNYIRMEPTSLAIKLTQSEEQLFGTLQQFKAELGLTTVMRVAGGWVRDKIMGSQSHDIDITLDNMKGEEFVIQLKKHAESKNEKISSFGVTKFNPELSKHLETATAKICGQNIDFVNLRSECYDEDSRIPRIEMGTPLTDALRRDFTINSLFYNLDTKLVEDWTEQGITDLHQKILRTPLPPLITFKDDPLRVLRCFRFKARFNFTVHESIYESLLNHEVHESLRTKVSKQRIGIELGGMLKAKHPLCAMEEMLRFGFWNIVFDIPSVSDFKDKELIEKVPALGFALMQLGMQSLEQNGLTTEKMLLVDPEIKDKRQRYTQEDLQVLIFLSLLTLPYQGYRVPDGKKWVGLAEHIAVTELKYSSKIAKFVQKTGELVAQLQTLLAEGHQTPFQVRVARWLRQAEQKWEIAIHCLHTIRLNKQEVKLEMEPMALREWIISQKLQDSFLVTAFIDGSFVIKKGKKGPIVKIILENAVLWRILNPQANEQQFLQVFEKEPAFFENDKSYV